MDRAPTIAIAGAGLAGLTAALLLARSGFKILLFERDPALSPAGAGIQLTPNAGRVFEALGLDASIADVAAEPAAIVVRSGRSGRRIVTMPLGPRFLRGFGLPYRTIHRADLHAILATAAAAEPGVELLLGHSVVEFADHPGGVTVLLEADSGDVEFAASALIGADGVGSMLRGLVPGGAERHETGYVAWRTVVQEANFPDGLRKNAIGLWLGPGGHIVHYPVKRGRDFNIVAVMAARHDPGAEHQEGEPSRLQRRYRLWAPQVRALTALESEWRPWPISTVDPAGAWSMGRFALLGDAAHAMSPYLAQGGAMAIEDAAVLASALAANPNDPATAIAGYERLRRARIRRVWRAANTTADLYHMGLLTGAVRNAGMRVIGGRALLGRYGWIYGWHPPSQKKERRDRAALSKVGGSELVK